MDDERRADSISVAAASLTKTTAMNYWRARASMLPHRAVEAAIVADKA